MSSSLSSCLVIVTFMYLAFAGGVEREIYPNHTHSIILKTRSY